MSERQVVVVSGGSRGLGAALIRELLDEGHAVATFSRTASPFIDEQNRRRAADFMWRAVDGIDSKALGGFVREVDKQFGRIDALVNNAGILLEGLLSLTRSEDIHRVIGVNLEGPIHLTRACVKVMLRQQQGAIVTISSLNATRGHRGVAAYSATKAALDGLTRSLARELGPSHIRVNSVAPGFFESEMTRGMAEAQRQQVLRRTPLGRFGAPEDMTGAVRFLLSPAARFITGQTLVVDGGLTC
ncbi:MAG: SDR family oxidoreductase [Deltaproteobacteria bacterium]|nr:SDR family oxidoreductase [Deltaproteobacteria bacterium]